jgi:hypothetical protein
VVILEELDPVPQCKYGFGFKMIALEEKGGAQVLDMSQQNQDLPD